MKIVETENLTKIYGSGEAQVNALDGVSYMSKKVSLSR